MKTRIKSPRLIALIACALCLAAALLAGCASPASSAATEAQKANRAYMSQVNLIMTDLKVDLASFVDAVSRDDVVNMRTQADNAYKQLDKLAELEAPAGLEDIQAKYVEGTEKLKQSLDGYISLYTDISSATESKPFDWSTYDKRLQDVQTLYDEGVEALDAGDAAAAAKE